MLKGIDIWVLPIWRVINTSYSIEIYIKLTIDFIIGLLLTKIRTIGVANTILVIINRYTKVLGYFTIIIIIIVIELVDLFLEQ